MKKQDAAYVDYRNSPGPSSRRHRDSVLISFSLSLSLSLSFDPRSVSPPPVFSPFPRREGCPRYPRHLSRGHPMKT